MIKENLSTHRKDTEKQRFLLTFNDDKIWHPTSCSQPKLYRLHKTIYLMRLLRLPSTPLFPAKIKEMHPLKPLNVPKVITNTLTSTVHLQVNLVFVKETLILLRSY